MILHKGAEPKGVPALELQNASKNDEVELAFTSVEGSLHSQIAFHRRWKTLTMACYAISSIGIVTCSSAAMLFAALNHGMTAAIFAAVSAVLASAEKSLLLREKWKIHLSVLVALQHLELELRSGLSPPLQALSEMKRINQSYAHDLPVESRTT